MALKLAITGQGKAAAERDRDMAIEAQRLAEEKQRQTEATLYAMWAKVDTARKRLNQSIESIKSSHLKER